MFLWRTSRCLGETCPKLCISIVNLSATGCTLTIATLWNSSGPIWPCKLRIWMRLSLYLRIWKNAKISGRSSSKGSTFESTWKKPNFYDCLDFVYFLIYLAISPSWDCWKKSKRDIRSSNSFLMRTEHKTLKRSPMRSYF